MAHPSAPATVLGGGQVVILDEASLASPFVLDEIVSAARRSGAKLLPGGDSAQLGSIDASGAFLLLIRDRGDLVPRPSDVRGFVAGWELEAASASAPVRMPTVVDYETHGRMVIAHAEMVAAVHTACRADIEAGSQTS